MNVGITCYPSVGGSGILATALGEKLAARGHEVHFISYERPFRFPAGAPRVHFHPVRVNGYDLFKYPDYTLPLSVKMAEVSCRHRLDVLHVHYAVPHATAAILARSMLGPDRMPRLVTTLHGTDTSLLGQDPGYGPAIHHALEHSDAVTTVSRSLADETRKVLGFQGAIEVIHNFFEPRPAQRTREAVRADLGVRDEVLLFHASNLRPLKRVELLLESIARVRPHHQFKLLILAGGSFEPYQSLVRRLGLADRVIVREKVAQIEDYMQAVDLGVFTSDTESFCLSILEAMFFGCPSVARHVGGIPEVVEHGKSGLLVNSEEPAAIAEAVESLIGHRERLAAMGSAARKRAEERFSAETIVPQYEALYRRLLG